MQIFSNRYYRFVRFGHEYEGFCTSITHIWEREPVYNFFVYSHDDDKVFDFSALFEEIESIEEAENKYFYKFDDALAFLKDLGKVYIYGCGERAFEVERPFSIDEVKAVSTIYIKSKALNKVFEVVVPYGRDAGIKDVRMGYIFIREIDTDKLDAIKKGNGDVDYTKVAKTVIVKDLTDEMFRDMDKEYFTHFEDKLPIYGVAIGNCFLYDCLYPTWAPQLGRGVIVK